MYDKVYKGFLGAALLFFAVYLITKIKVLGAVGGGFLLLTALARLFIDYKTDNLPWKEERDRKEREIEEQMRQSRERKELEAKKQKEQQ